MHAAAALWLLDLDGVAEGDLQRCRDWLSASEAARCERFVRELRRRQFVAGRVLLRMALGCVLGVAPRAVRLEERTGQAPLLAAPLPQGGAPGSAPGGAPGFSIAHSGRWVACAVSAQTALGLDIELRDAGRDLDALAAQAFDAGELARWACLRTLEDRQRINGFYDMWSGKEARFKLGGAEGGHCVFVPHAELSVALCSGLPLTQPLRIESATLAASWALA